MAPSKVNLRRTVDLIRVEQKPLISAIEVVGLLEPEAISEIAAGVTGIVDEVLFREGDEVDPKRPVPLIRIDQKKFQTALRIAEANEKEALATFNAARDSWQRIQSSTSGAFSAENRKQVLETLNASEARHLSLMGAIDAAKLNLDRSRVAPPFRGQINTRKVAQGMYVEERTVIGTIADLSRIRLVGYVPESVATVVRNRMLRRPPTNAARVLMAGLGNIGGFSFGPGVLNDFVGQFRIASGEIPSGFDAEFTLQALPNRRFYANLFFMSRVADPQTHMFETKAEIPPTTPGIDQLFPGYTARIRYPLETSPEACVVPEEALRATERGFIVYAPLRRTNRDGTIEWIAHATRVEPGSRTPGSVEIRSGLLAGQWIVRRGAESLEEGTPLRIPPEQEKALLDATGDATR